MEYIQFNEELSISDIVIIIKEIIEPSDKYEVNAGNILSETATGVSDGRFAVPRTLCFVDRMPDQENIEALTEAFIITNWDIAPALDSSWVMAVDDPRALFINLLHRFKINPGFSSFTSIVNTKPNTYSTEAEIHPQAIIEEGVFIGRGTSIAAGCVIKEGTCIGCNTIIRENTTIGCDGISLYKTNDGKVLRFPHLASVIIGDGVEIGASCVIPRGVLTSTYIGQNTVIGNLTNVGHSVKIGRWVWLSVGCLIGGNTTIGDRSSLGLGVSVRDNLQIGDNCSVGMGSVVVKDVPGSSSVFGNPAKNIRDISVGPER